MTFEEGTKFPIRPDENGALSRAGNLKSPGTSRHKSDFAAEQTFVFRMNNADHLEEFSDERLRTDSL
jgi:hypothetical protein